MKFKGVVNIVKNWARKNSTKILAGIAIISEATGFYFMHKEAPIVRDRLDELDENAKWYEKLKVAGPVYLPAIGMFILSSGSIVGGCILGEKRVAALSSLYSVTELMAKKSEEKIEEMLGGEKAKEYHDKVAQELMDEKPMKPGEVYLTGKGNTLFFDPLSGRYFRSSLDAVKNDNADFKNYITDNIWGSVNDWYEFLGLQKAELADYFGWNVNQPLSPWFDEGHSTDNELCWVIRHINLPVTGDEGKDYSRTKKIEDLKGSL